MQMQSLWKSDPYTVHTYLGGKSFFESILRKESSTFCGSLNSSKEILRNHIRVANIASSKVYPTAIMPHIYKYKLLRPRSARETKVSSVVLRNLRDFGPMLRRRRTASASIGRPFRLSRRVFLSPNNRVEEEKRSSEKGPRPWLVLRRATYIGCSSGPDLTRHTSLSLWRPKRRNWRSLRHCSLLHWIPRGEVLWRRNDRRL
jgi:hypothetical protein